jgi:2-polyprenyl-3-methyl-5-hydroxy-6-metoxy-1,4-benzoquinol methylase
MPKPDRNKTPDFDAVYYHRFYIDPETRAQSPASARRQADFIAAYARYLELPVRRILDVGCGIGRILHRLQTQYPSARCDGIEYSNYLCQKYGWTEASVVDYRSRAPYDLVICNDVLPSLDDRSCRAAISNLAELCRGALFLGGVVSGRLEHL